MPSPLPVPGFHGLNPSVISTCFLKPSKVCHIVEHLVCYIDLLYLFLEFQHLIPTTVFAFPSRDFPLSVPLPVPPGSGDPGTSMLTLTIKMVFWKPSCVPGRAHRVFCGNDYNGDGTHVTFLLQYFPEGQIILRKLRLIHLSVKPYMTALLHDRELSALFVKIW